MARQLRTIIELNAAQTKQFLASLSDNRNEKNRKKAIARAKKLKFNIVL